MYIFINGHFVSILETFHVIWGKRDWPFKEAKSLLESQKKSWKNYWDFVMHCRRKVVDGYNNYLKKYCHVHVLHTYLILMQQNLFSFLLNTTFVKKKPTYKWKRPLNYLVNLNNTFFSSIVYNHVHIINNIIVLLSWKFWVFSRDIKGDTSLWNMFD